MGNFSGGGRAVCPYYVKEANLSITCEGIIPGTDVMMRFTTKEEKREHQKKRCEIHNYLNCPQAAALEERERKILAIREQKLAIREHPDSLGNRIASARDKRGMSQRRLATKSFISAGYLSEIENDKKHPSIDTLMLICAALQVDAAYLLDKKKKSEV